MTTGTHASTDGRQPNEASSTESLSLARPEALVQFTPLVFAVIGYLTAWTLVWGIQAWLAPTWLTDSRTGIETILQVVPAIVLTLYALIVASVFVVAQLAITNYGTRAAIMMLRDPGLRQLIVRPFALAIGSLFLLGQVPDSGEPSSALSAAAATIVLATIPVIYSAAVGLPTTLQQYTAPVTFATLVLNDVEDDLSNGYTNLVVFKVPLLGEMLKTSIRRGDSAAVIAGLHGLRHFHDAYLRAAERNPHARLHSYDDGVIQEGWLGETLRLSLERAGEEGLKLGASEEETNGVAWTLRDVAVKSINADHVEEASAFINGLTQLAVTVHQVSPGGMINFFAAPTQALAGIEGAAERHGNRDLATQALASWALGSAYPEFHFQLGQHPTFDFDVSDMGPSPPFLEAKALVASDDWRRRWSNKQYRGPRPVEKVLDRAQRAHGRLDHAATGT